MALKQSRRSISVNRGLYEKAKEHAYNSRVALSKFTEDALAVAIHPGLDGRQLAHMRARIESLAGTEGLPGAVLNYLKLTIDEVDAMARPGGATAGAGTMGHAQAPDAQAADTATQ